MRIKPHYYLSPGLALLCLVSTANGGEPVPEGILYYVTPLGYVPGGEFFSLATGINELGQITGNSDVDRSSEAFLWDPVEGMIGLGALPNDRPYSMGLGLNNVGHVVGYSDVPPDGEAAREAFLWTPEQGMIGLGDLPGGLYYSSASGINDLEQVVGYGHSPDGDEAFLWDADNGMIGLGELPGGQFLSQARDINNAGQVVGLSVSALRGVEAFIWDAENGMRPLGTDPFGRYGEVAYAINELGQVSGYTNTLQAFFWDPDDGMLALDLLHEDDGYNKATGLNDLGQLVGRGRPWPAGPLFGFIWDAEHGMRDLEDLLAAGTDPLYALLRLAWDINNAGQIAGQAENFEAILLTPFVLGDLNCDEAVDEHDLDALLLLLLDPDEYEQTYADCPGQWAGDVNQDGVLDMTDWAALRRYLSPRPVPARPARDPHPQPLSAAP